MNKNPVLLTNVEHNLVLKGSALKSLKLLCPLLFILHRKKTIMTKLLIVDGIRKFERI